MYQDTTANAARGKWRGILMELGVPSQSLKNKHGPCPLCGSKDNFRFDDKEGRGTWICTCGSGSGMDLAMKFKGQPFREVVRMIDGIVGNVKYAPPSQSEMTDEKRRAILRQAYMDTQEVAPGDLVHRYLETRCVDELIYPKALRFAPRTKDGDGGLRPAMVAMIEAPGHDRPVSMHRTFLRSDGLAKAEMESPRKVMPGTLPDGACVRLSPWSQGCLGVAEGIETAMSASAIFHIPVWAALNTSMLKKWVPPQGCDEVAIFGDNDPKFAGQAAAWILAHRLAVKGIRATVHIPSKAGTDWNDEYLRDQIRSKEAAQ